MGYTLIIAEKPNAALKIAQSLAEDRPKTIEGEGGVKYYEFKRGGKKHVVVPAVGHLFSLKDTSKKGWDYPIFDYTWKPTYEINKKAEFAKRYLDNIRKVAKDADAFIISTDFDIEGSVIGFNVLKFACGTEKGKRMKFSTLTKQDIVEAYENAMPNLDYPQIESGLARHELDFLWGVNTSRALTLAVKKAGKKLSFYLLSAGRVQTPMLYFLSNKEKEIQAFKPDPFWQILTKIELTKKLIVESFHEEDKFWEKKKAETVFAKCKSKTAKVLSVEKKTYKQTPPHPFDLTTLQTESYRFFGWSPKQTTNIAQSLYEGGYISYPRTSSQKLPPQIGYASIMKALAGISVYTKLCNKLLAGALKPNEGEKTDAAHPAVFPTSEPPELAKLNGQQKKLYDLIVRRFLAAFAEPAERESVKVTFDISGERFPATGRRTVEAGWTEYYGKYSGTDELIFPSMKEGDTFKVKSAELLSKETTPPPRFSQGSIVKEMEKHNLGTKTTRAQILQTLYDRGYIEGKSIKVNDLGMRVASSMEKYVPDIVSEDLTRTFEQDMEAIEGGKKKREDVVNEAKKVMAKIAKEFKENEMKIGASLEKSILETKQKQSILGPCPNCGNNLKILWSPRTKKRFVGCGGYPKCRTGFPIPLVGMITATGKICEKCRTPIIQCWRKGKRPFNMCLDPKCETKADWGKPKEGVKDVRNIVADHEKTAKPKKAAKAKKTDSKGL